MRKEVGRRLQRVRKRAQQRILSPERHPLIPRSSSPLPRPAPFSRCRRCQLIQGTPALRPQSGYSDFVWAAKDELGEYIQDQPTLELLQKML